jgi:hypothetical protein
MTSLAKRFVALGAKIADIEPGRPLPAKWNECYRPGKRHSGFGAIRLDSVSTCR